MRWRREDASPEMWKISQPTLQKAPSRDDIVVFLVAQPESPVFYQRKHPVRRRFVFEQVEHHATLKPKDWSKKTYVEIPMLLFLLSTGLRQTAIPLKLFSLYYLKHLTIFPDVLLLFGYIKLDNNIMNRDSTRKNITRYREDTKL